MRCREPKQKRKQDVNVKRNERHEVEMITNREYERTGNEREDERDSSEG